MIDVARLIAEAREKRSLTQKELAAKLGLSQSIVAEWERGARPVPDKHIAKLAKLLELDPWAIEVQNGRIPDALKDVDPMLIVKALKPLAKAA